MSTTLIAGGRGSGSVAASTTIFVTLGAGFVSAAALPTAENQAQIPVRSAGHYSNLFCSVSSNNRGASTLTFRIGAVDGTESVSIGSSATGEFVDATGSDTVAAGNLVDAKLVTGAGGTSFVHRIVGAMFSADSLSVSVLGGYTSTQTFNTNATTYNQAISGQANPTSARAEADVQFKVKSALTWSNLYCFLSANTYTAGGTYKSRVGGSNGGQSISITASTTGAFEDQAGSDSLSVNNLINGQLITGASSGSITLTTLASKMASSGSAQLFANCAGAGFAPAASLTQNLIVSGDLSSGSATESDCQMNCRQAMVFSNLALYVQANAASTSTTFKFRVNGANGNQAVSFASSATGYAEDATNVDSVAPGAEINYQLITGATSTCTFTVAGCKAVLPRSVPPSVL